MYTAYLNARKGKRYRDEVLDFTNHLEENLIQLQNELIWKTYKQGRYREFYVSEPKRRLIMALPFRDRVVQWSIYQQLKPIVESRYIFDSYACRPGKGAHAALARIKHWLKVIPNTDSLYYLKLDVHKYFYRIDHDILMNIYARFVDDPDLMWLLEQIIRSNDGNLGVIDGSQDYSNRTAGVGMAVGNLVSQMSANVYLNELDQYIKHTLRVKHYARYMDDMIILHHDKPYLHQIRSDIEAFLDDRLALRTNGKTQIKPIKQGVEWVGYRVWPTYCLVRRSTSKRMRQRLRGLSKAYANGNAELSEINQSVQSYLGVLKHCDSYRLKKAIFGNLVFRRG